MALLYVIILYLIHINSKELKPTSVSRRTTTKLFLLIVFLYLPMMKLKSQPDTKKISFPTITGEILSGGYATFPEYAKGKVALITLVYEDKGNYQLAQNQSLAWQEYWNTTLRDLEVAFYEIPMLSSKYKYMRLMTNTWMRQGIPKNFHPNVVTVYGEKQAVVKLLHITNVRDCFVCLVDAQGYILQTYAGAPNTAAEAALKALVVAQKP